MEEYHWRLVNSTIREESVSVERLTSFSRLVIFPEILPTLPRRISIEAAREKLEKFATCLDYNPNGNGLSVLLTACNLDMAEEGLQIRQKNNGQFQVFLQSSYVEELLRVGVSPYGTLVSDGSQSPEDILLRIFSHAAAARSTKTMERLLAVRPSLISDAENQNTGIPQEMVRYVAQLDPACGKLLEDYVKHGPVPLPKLAKEGKNWAVFNLLRRGKVGRGEMIEKFDGKTVIEYAGMKGDKDLVVELQFWAMLGAVGFTPRTGTWIEIVKTSPNQDCTGLHLHEAIQQDTGIHGAGNELSAYQQHGMLASFVRNLLRRPLECLDFLHSILRRMVPRPFLRTVGAD